MPLLLCLFLIESETVSENKQSKKGILEIPNMTHHQLSNSENILDNMKPSLSIPKLKDTLQNIMILNKITDIHKLP